MNGGIALHDMGDLGGAIAEWREAIRLKPDCAEAHYNLGKGLEAQGEKQAALADYHKASELNSGDEEFRAAYEQLSKELKR